MRIRFSKHALERIVERFPGVLDALTRIIERALCDRRATGRHVRREVEGVIDGRRVRVVLVGKLTSVLTVITAMWC